MLPVPAAVAAPRATEVRFRSAALADLFLLLFPSGTRGAPPAVPCRPRPVALAGVPLTPRFRLGRA
ncbi:hypothetical protein C3R44_23240, partial [Mycobacterium tuberculosis]